jgi:hypothetical protein
MTTLDDIGFERYRPLGPRARSGTHRSRHDDRRGCDRSPEWSARVRPATSVVYLRAETLEELQFSSIFTVVTDGASVLVALLAIAVVHRTTERQEARVEQLRGTSPADTEGESGIFPPPE